MVSCFLFLLDPSPINVPTMLLLTHPHCDTRPPVNMHHILRCCHPLPATQTTVGPSPRYIKVDQLGAVSTRLAPVPPCSRSLALPARWPQLKKTPTQTPNNLHCQPHTPVIYTMIEARLWHILSHKRPAG